MFGPIVCLICQKGSVCLYFVRGCSSFFFFVFEDLLKLKFQMLISVSVERW